MALYVYRQSSGDLVSWSPDDDCVTATSEEMAAEGLVCVSGLASLDVTHGWDKETRSVVSTSVPPAVRSIGTPKWVLRFTAAEMIAIRSSTDADVQHMLYALQFSYSIDLNDPDVVAGVGLLASLGLIAQPRVAEILA